MTPSAVRVLVTRPAAEAQRWTQALRERGIEADSLPLIEIAPLDDTTALHNAWQAMPRHAAVMFVSANAVQHFMVARPAGQLLQAQAWGTGPGTQAALIAAGWPPEQIRCPAADADKFDSEALWAQVQADVRAWAGRSVLIVRGADASGQLAGRDWLAQQLQAAGCGCSNVWPTCVVPRSWKRRSRLWPAAPFAMAAGGCSAALKPHRTWRSSCPAPLARPREPWPPIRASPHACSSRAGGGWRWCRPRWRRRSPR